ncbi:MAG: hypothetical protein AUI14_18570 [Actinobacteria bacterium 13_2_20CM_2_71_6]|nr:MAG: hypothetical protein AUI14_18570 [Actinobacteria bacterium 13_2_20CM_2_71_6]
MAALPVPQGRGRRAVLGSLALAAVGGPIAVAAARANAGTTTPLAAKAPKLVWSPNPLTDGLNAFEGIEDDRANSEPGVKHIYVKNGVYHWDMHRKQRDTSKDRQRNEVKGMRSGNTVLTMGKGETWRFTYDLFIPSTLHGTSHFTHIFQLKRPGPGTGPLVTMSLRRNGSQEQLALRAFASGGDIGATALSPLRDHWVGVDMTFLIGDKGSAHFVLTDGGRTVVDGTRNNIDIWLGDRIRPKWGIYRSVQSTASDIIDCSMEIRNFKAYLG